MKNETVKLGSLGLGEAFHFPNRKTVYQTIDYRPSNANVSYGSRSCYNTRTGKAELKRCSEKVFHDSQSSENSEINI
jgi:hypothetical protein